MELHTLSVDILYCIIDWLDLLSINRLRKCSKFLYSIINIDKYTKLHTYKEETSYKYFNYILDNGKQILHGEYYEYADSGNLEVNANYHYGNLIGLYSLYHPNGKYWLVEYYKYDTTDNSSYHSGEQTYYYVNGSTQSQYNYAKGKKHGTCVGYYLNGAKSRVINYNNDIRHGEYIDYFNDGNIYVIYHYDNGVICNTSYIYWKTGNIRHKIIPEGVYCDIIEYYENGNKLARYKCYHKYAKHKHLVDNRHEIIEGLYTSYYESGNLHIRCTYTKGKRNGEYMEYHDHKYTRIKVIANYNNGKLHNEYREYDINGYLKSIYHYDNGIIKKYKLYYPISDDIVREEYISENYWEETIYYNIDSSKCRTILKREGIVIEDTKH